MHTYTHTHAHTHTHARRHTHTHTHTHTHKTRGRQELSKKVKTEKGTEKKRKKGQLHWLLPGRSYSTKGEQQSAMTNPHAKSPPLVSTT